MKLEEAEAIALRIVERLRPSCRRIEIAGSIRRRKADVGDIEIVAEPLPVFDLFGSPAGYADLSLPYRANKNGPRYKQYILPDINLDLFIVLPPAQWGVIFALRTGGAEFSRRLVTPRIHHGFLPAGYYVEDGAVHRVGTGEIVPTPEEADFLALCGVADIPPQERP